MTFTYVPAIDLNDDAEMTSFTVTLNTGRELHIDDADTYQPEGPLTTFFRTGSSSPSIDIWAERVASFRTADITSIHRSVRPVLTHPSAQNLDAHHETDGPFSFEDGGGSHRLSLVGA